MSASHGSPPAAAASLNSKAFIDSIFLSFSSHSVGVGYAKFDERRRADLKENCATRGILMKAIMCLCFSIYTSSSLGTVLTIISFSIFLL